MTCNEDDVQFADSRPENISEAFEAWSNYLYTLVLEFKLTLLTQLKTSLKNFLKAKNPVSSKVSAPLYNKLDLVNNKAIEIPHT